MINESNKRLQNRTASSVTVQKLHQGPMTAKELGSFGGGQIRNLVCKLKKPDGSSGSKTRPGKQGNSDTVYYLWGDERQAVRCFIDEWPEYVESCMGDDRNPLKIYWEDVMWNLLSEEWHIKQEENN